MQGRWSAPHIRRGCPGGWDCRRVDSTSADQAYSRAELARDSAGRLWVQAFRLETDGSSTAVLAVSTDEGATFQLQPSLDRVPGRGGGRLLSLGSQLLFVYGLHDGFIPACFRLRDDGAPLGEWGPVQEAFPEGIYHGAALSAVADGHGGMHLVYKDEGERLVYRSFQAGSFGPRVLLDDRSDWALQAATTLVGERLYVFSNHVRSSTSYELWGRVLEGGTFSAPVVLDSSSTFKGYPGAAETLPDEGSGVPCLFGKTPDASSSGNLARVALLSGAAPSPEGGGTPDAGTPAPGEVRLPFADAFDRADGPGLGAAWDTHVGLWRTQKGKAVSDLEGANRAHVAAARCLDCRVAADVTLYGASAGVFLRGSEDTQTRYEALLSGSDVSLRRVSGGTVTELGRAASGVPDQWTAVRLELVATGTSPVTLIVRTRGVERLRVADSAPARLVETGRTGLVTPRAGVPFDAFALTSEAGTGGADAGTPDAGTIDAGTPDGGTPDAGTPDAGTPDAGTPDAGTPDAGTIDAGTPEAGTPDAGTPGGEVVPQRVFSDAFEGPDTSSGLGSSWEVVRGLWLRSKKQAVSDLNGDDLALARTVSVLDADAKVDVTTYGAGQVGLVVRAEGNLRRYEALLFSDGTVRLYRVRDGSRTELGRTRSGATESWRAQHLEVSVRGSSQVQLVVRVNGTPRLSVTDTQPGSLAQPGRAGLWTKSAGVPFDNFELWSVPSSDAPADGGTP